MSFICIKEFLHVPIRAIISRDDMFRIGELNKSLMFNCGIVYDLDEHFMDLAVWRKKQIDEILEID